MRGEKKKGGGGNIERMHTTAQEVFIQNNWYFRTMTYGLPTPLSLKNLNNKVLAGRVTHSAKNSNHQPQHFPH